MINQIEERNEKRHTLHVCIDYNNKKSFDFLMNNEKIDCNIKNGNGDTPLIHVCAVKSGKSGKSSFDIDVTYFIEKLVNGGADVNVKDLNGKTAWDIAIERERGDSVKLLIENCAGRC